MNNNEFRAILVSETENKEFKREVVTRHINDLPDGDVLINVKYSSLNYKDALSATGNKGVTRDYPHTPGIDAAGIVVENNNSSFAIGSTVLVTGYALGMSTSGGYAEYIRVPSKWVVKLPEKLSLRESMIYGTAGFTAALSIYKLINSGVKPSDGDILVTGSTGGVGSIAISILSKLGYDVTASTGKLSEKEMLLGIGAKQIVDRNDLDDNSGRAVLKSRWAGVIDTVGGNILATAIKSTNYGGTVTCCGNVASDQFSSSVYPFILKGVSLLGIDSVKCPMDIRLIIWDKLSSDWKPNNLGTNVDEVSLDGLSEKIDMILEGKHKGRTIINIEL
ncbi:YhdH/YhfP family quinone oxidoreductase [Clostridium lacusfryxellense]|uniref:YhdH/YhfP family quinone oxidoreductase n=1 Tax=Clostridium lacusfryxellense TaxID=205328 RepID=UPI001C0C0AFE|nr:YhdH/YhfP family quinone oxidoreductase [Clostridium lacusfryxellense]MBU3111234.1 YhdH/YhfP family quinone oxidoreductase [Clostridium lacusfryxellense]